MTAAAQVHRGAFRDRYVVVAESRRQPRITLEIARFASRAQARRLVEILTRLGLDAVEATPEQLADVRYRMVAHGRAHAARSGS